jgi:hypothetical protein
MVPKSTDKKAPNETILCSRLSAIFLLPALCSVSLPLSSGDVLTMFHALEMAASLVSTISPARGAYRSLVAFTLSMEPNDSGKGES